MMAVLLVPLTLWVVTAVSALPPAPPLGPVPPPQPNCTTCHFPVHSWATIPASIHTSRRNTNSDGSFTDADIEVFKKFSLITMEKWQGQDATDATGARAFLWEEDAWIASAKQIKAVNPTASVVVWMDTMLVYTGWRLDGNTSAPINHTLNPDAVAACATGHFRPAEFIERYPSLLVPNSSGLPAITQYGQCHVYDHRLPRVQQYWRDNCLKMTASGVIDGCGADFSAGGPNSEARNTVDNTMEFLGVNESVATVWRAGKRQMMIDTTVALGGGLLVGKDAAELGDHVNAVIHEGCQPSNGTILLLRSITAKSRDLGKRLVYQCHTTEGLEDGSSLGLSTVAGFLIGAGPDHYIAAGGWSDGAESGHWFDIFSRPLGAPLADAVYDPATTVWSRYFASGTKVSFNVTASHSCSRKGCTAGTIDWAH